MLVELIEGYGKPEYYTQLSGAYSEANEDKKALAVMQLAYRVGILDTDKELLQLARMYLFHDIPIRAAEVIEKGLGTGVLEGDVDTMKLLSDAYIAAREPQRSFAPLALAARQSDDGDLYVRLGQAYIAAQMWQKADQALGRALAKGDLKDVANTHLLRGIARMNLQNWRAATASFNAAGQHEKLRDTADQYKRYLKQRQVQVRALRG